MQTQGLRAILRLMGKVHYGKLVTEQTNPRSKKIDRVSIEKAVEIMHTEDAGVSRAVYREKKQVARGVRLITAALKKGGRLFFAGAGTSGRLGVIEAAECPPTFSTPPALVQAVMAGGKRAVFRSKEGAEDNAADAKRIFRKKLRANDILVGIAASGVTPFVLSALKTAKAKGLKTILVTCNKKLPVGKLADCIIAPVTGPEVISGSTRLKAGTATKMVLNMLTVVSMIQMGKVYQNWMVDLQPKSAKLKARALRLVGHLGGVPERHAARLLENSGRNAKTAILMARTGWGAEAARQKLRKSSGFLTQALKGTG